MKQKIEIELDIPEGYEFDRLKNRVSDGDSCLVSGGKVSVSPFDWFAGPSAWVITLRPVEVWRDAEPNDLKNGPFEGRVSDDGVEWKKNTIVSYDTYDLDRRWCTVAYRWKYAQIKETPK